MSVFFELSDSQFFVLTDILSIASEGVDESSTEYTLLQDMWDACRGEHVATNKAIRDFRGEGWNNAALEISALPCWIQDKENHGFDFGDDENGFAVETGARKYVMEILLNNPYSDSYVDPRANRKPRGIPRRKKEEND